MSIQPWRQARLIRVEPEAHQTRRFWFEVPELKQFDFEPGQFVTLDLPIHEKPNKRWRSYSIASWPDGTNRFELIIVRNQEGPGTKFLFEEAQPGMEIPCRGPQGHFTLPEKLEKDLVLICTGTGIAPFRSMVQHVLRNGIPHKHIHLVFGTRTSKDLLYFEELKKLSADYPSFHYHPVLSREHWEGAHGYVHGVYETLAQDQRPAEFYLCGWKDMIRQAKENILSMGYDKSVIHQEIYG
jgi:CDP-4-dehydro-6-deoxyglucose reductase